MRRSKYPTDLSDTEWASLRPYLPAPKKRVRGRPRVHSPREILIAIFYLLKSCCPWRLLTRDFPPWKSVCLPLVREVAHRRYFRAAQRSAARAFAGTAREKLTVRCGDSRFSVGQDKRGRWRTQGIRRRKVKSVKQPSSALTAGRLKDLIQRCLPGYHRPRPSLDECCQFQSHNSLIFP